MLLKRGGISMSVALFAVEGNDIYADTKITFSEPVSTEEFYQKYWRKAIKELNIKLFKDGSQFGYPNLNNEKTYRTLTESNTCGI